MTMSMDLQRVFASVLQDGMSARGPAARFEVSDSSAIRWVRRQREPGSFAPPKIGGYKPPLRAGELRDWLLERAGVTSPCAVWSPNSVGAA